MAETVAVPREAFGRLVKRTLELRYPADESLTKEEAARRFHLLGVAYEYNPALLVEDLMEVLDKLETKGVGNAASVSSHGGSSPAVQ